jgi:predicted MFS family arabinose efflux permease
MITTPRFGKWADRIGARRARFILTTVQLFVNSLLLVTGHSLWLLIIPLILTNTFGPSIDVTGRMTFLSKSPDVRTRLMTVYIVLLFLGGGFGSWVGPA